MIPDSTTHIDADNQYYSITDDFVMLWQPDFKTWRVLAFEPDELKKYLDLHDIRSFKEWGDGL